MARIFKYQLDSDKAEQQGDAALIVEMPKEAKILSVGVQHGTVCIWAEVDNTAKTEMREFTVIGTGYVVPEDVKFLGTVQLHDGHIVLHVYEKI